MAMNEEYLALKHIHNLENIKGQHTECISIYIAAGKSLHDVVAQLQNEKFESSNIKDKTNRGRVEGGLEKIINTIKNLKINSTGYCIFGNYLEVYVFTPIRLNKLNKYICGKKYDLQHLKNIIYDTSDTYGLVALDGSECTIAKLCGDQLDILEEIDSEVKNKTIKGGQSARRYRNARDESLNYYYGEVSMSINSYFNESVSKIYYGGNIPASEEYLAKMPYLNPKLKSKFSKCYPLPFTDRFGIRCLLDKISQQMELDKYKKAQLELEELQNKLKNAPKSTEIKQIYISESMLSAPIESYIIECIPIRVYKQGHPISNYITEVYSGILYLNF